MRKDLSWNSSGSAIPESSLRLSIRGIKSSVSKTDCFPFRLVTTLSTPIPVSTFLWARGTTLPSFFFSYSMKTSFHISAHLLSLGSNFKGAFPLPVQKNISVSRPQGPASPTGPHQLSRSEERRVG